MRKVEYNHTTLDKLPIALSLYLANVFDFPELETRDLLISRFVSLKDELIAVYEYPYVDKLYRDTYYNYFSVKHKSYYRNCVRISFFKSDFDISRLMTYQYVQGDECLGFICIRPKFPNIFGRGVLSPQALKVSNFEVCGMEVDVLIKGARFKFKGFPFTSQDKEYMVCAETAIWETVEYFGNKYPEYRTILPSEIIKILSTFSDQRDVPSHGLHANQISYVLKRLGFDVRMYSRSSYELDNPPYSNFFKTLQYYVASAMPVIGILKSKANTDDRHAVLYIGYAKPSFNDIKDDIYSEPNGRIMEYADLIDRYIICDDNRLIYQFANFSIHGGNPGYKYLSYYPTNNEGKIYELDTIIVTLPHRVYLEAVEAKEFIQAVVKEPEMGIENRSEMILKTFFTTSKSFKNWIVKSGTIDIRVKELIINTAMPKFVWIGELSTQSLIQSDKANGLIVIDATQPEVSFADSLLFVWASNIIWYHNTKGTLDTLQETISAEFKSYKNFN